MLVLAVTGAAAAACGWGEAEGSSDLDAPATDSADGPVDMWAFARCREEVRVAHAGLAHARAKAAGAPLPSVPQLNGPARYYLPAGSSDATWTIARVDPDAPCSDDPAADVAPPGVDPADFSRCKLELAALEQAVATMNAKGASGTTEEMSAITGGISTDHWHWATDGDRWWVERSTTPMC